MMFSSHGTAGVRAYEMTQMAASRASGSRIRGTRGASTSGSQYCSSAASAFPTSRSRCGSSRRTCTPLSG
ncbi:MAG: hypothetical protein ACYTGX_19170, partial [Planctomycetota bacterium]